MYGGKSSDVVKLKCDLKLYYVCYEKDLWSCNKLNIQSVNSIDVGIWTSMRVSINNKRQYNEYTQPDIHLIVFPHIKMLEGTSTTIYKMMRYHQQRAKWKCSAIMEQNVEIIEYNKYPQRAKRQWKHWVNLSHYLWNEQFDVMAYHKSNKRLCKNVR